MLINVFAVNEKKLLNGLMAENLREFKAAS